VVGRIVGGVGRIGRAGMERRMCRERSGGRVCTREYGPGGLVCGLVEVMEVGGGTYIPRRYGGERA